MIYIGEITEIENDRLHVIRFNVPNYIEGAIAYPIHTTDEPVVGDKVFITNLDPLYNTSFLYRKMGTDNDIKMRYKDKSICILEDKIELSTSEASLTLNDSGEIKLMKGTAEVTISASGSISIKGESVSIDSTLTTSITGIANPSSPGPFCAIPNCLFTGTPHTGKDAT